MTHKTKKRWSIEYPTMADVLPEVACGNARIVHMTLSKDDVALGNLRCMMDGDRHGHCEPGRYAKLVIGNSIMMSDTPMEHNTNMAFLHRATGRVLIGGLGIGLIVHPLMTKPGVEHVTVVESNPNVIELVAPSLYLRYGARIDIVRADVFTWAPPKGALWDTIYFDIWPFVTQDNLPEYAQLVRHYQRRLNRANPDAWMGGWRIEEMRDERDRDRRAGVAWY